MVPTASIVVGGSGRVASDAARAFDDGGRTTLARDWGWTSPGTLRRRYSSGLSFFFAILLHITLHTSHVNNMLNEYDFTDVHNKNINAKTLLKFKKNL